MSEQRMITLNFRRAMEKGPNYKRGRYAITYLREFVSKHMKAAEVKISPSVSNLVFEKGAKNPPTKLKVVCSKDEKGIVSVDLVKSSTK